MEDERESVLEVRETFTEEFLVDGVVVERVAETEKVDVHVAVVTVALSNGAEHPFRYTPDELAERLRDEAVELFVREKKITADPTLTLFKGKTELNLNATLGTQGVHAGDELLLASTKPHVDGE